MSLENYDHVAHLKSEIARLQGLKANTQDPTTLAGIEGNLALLNIDLDSLTQPQPSAPEQLDFSGVDMDEIYRGMAEHDAQEQAHLDAFNQACQEATEVLAGKTMGMQDGVWVVYETGEGDGQQ